MGALFNVPITGTRPEKNIVCGDGVAGVYIDAVLINEALWTLRTKPQGDGVVLTDAAH